MVPALAGGRIAFFGTDVCDSYADGRIGFFGVDFCDSCADGEINWLPGQSACIHCPPQGVNCANKSFIDVLPGYFLPDAFNMNSSISTSLATPIHVVPLPPQT